MLVFKSFFYEEKEKKKNVGSILSCWAHSYSLGEHWASNVALHLIIGGNLSPGFFSLSATQVLKTARTLAFSDSLISF